jgi:hypothetical protein
MNSRYLFLSALTLMVAALLFAIMRSPGEHSPSTVRATTLGDALSHREARPQQPVPSEAQAAGDIRSPDVEKLASGIQQLRREVESLKRHDAEQSLPVATDAALSLVEEEQIERERTMRTTAVLESSFQRETRDPVWSMQAETQVSAAFDTEDIAAGSQLQQIACQATVCRIHSQHDDPTAEQTFIMNLGLLQAFGNGEAFTARTEHPDGSVQIVTYVTREGHRLHSQE